MGQDDPLYFFSDFLFPHIAIFSLFDYELTDLNKVCREFTAPRHKKVKRPSFFFG